MKASSEDVGKEVELLLRNEVAQRSGFSLPVLERLIDFSVECGPGEGAGDRAR